MDSTLSLNIATPPLSTFFGSRKGAGIIENQDDRRLRLAVYLIFSTFITFLYHQYIISFTGNKGEIFKKYFIFR